MNRTRIHNVIHEQSRIQSSIHYITILWCASGEDFTIHEYLSSILLWKSVVWVLFLFFIFLLVAERPLFVSLPLQHDRCKQTEEWNLHIARKCLARKWHIKHRKTNQVLQLACFSKTQKPIGCGTTTRKCQLLTGSLPPLGHTHIRMKISILSFYLHFLA